MYKLLDRPPGVGDVIRDCRNGNIWLYNSCTLSDYEILRWCKVVETTDADAVVNSGYFTQPGSGTFISLSTNDYRTTGECYNFTGAVYSGVPKLHYTDNNGYTRNWPGNNNIKILLKHDVPELRKCIIDLGNSSLADRIKLWQILKDNGCSVSEDMLVNVDPLRRSLVCVNASWTNDLVQPNVTLKAFLDVFYKGSAIRGLAFKKRHDTPWTPAEGLKVQEFINNEDQLSRSESGVISDNLYGVMFDDGTLGPYMACWTFIRHNPSKCLTVYYEDVFPEDTTTQGTIIRATGSTTVDFKGISRDILQGRKFYNKKITTSGWGENDVPF